MMTRRHFAATAAALAAVPRTAPAAPAAPPPAFQLGLVSYNLAAKWDLPTYLKICPAVGVKAVEFRTTHAHKVEPTLSPDERQEVRKKFADAGVVIWGLGTTCEFHATDSAVVQKQVAICGEFVRLAADLGARGVKVRPNGLPKEVPIEKTLAQISRALRSCGQVAADAGVEIWVEVHGPGTQKPEHMKTIMAGCDHPAVGVCWNSNATDVQKGSVAESFALLKPWLKSCHINELYKDASGQYPYRELFQLLRQSGYDRYTLIEAAKTPGSADDGAELLRYYKALWAELCRG